MYMYCVYCTMYVCVAPAGYPSIPAAPRVSDPQVRDSVDFGELLESREDREEDKQRK